MVQILIIRFWEKCFHYLSFNFRVKPLLLLGVQYRWSFPSCFRNSTSFSEAELCWLEGTYSHRVCVCKLSAKGVNSLFYFKVFLNVPFFSFPLNSWENIRPLLTLKMFVLLLEACKYFHKYSVLKTCRTYLSTFCTVG